MSYNILNSTEDESTSEQQTKIGPSFGERLGLIAVIITTIGDILATVSAGILIDEGIKEAKESEKEKQSQDQQFLEMQKQIDSLKKEILQMKTKQ